MGGSGLSGSGSKKKKRMHERAGGESNQFVMSENMTSAARGGYNEISESTLIYWQV